MTYLRKKLAAIAGLLRCLIRGEFCLFLCEIANHLPDWLFRFKAGTIMTTTSPKIICRNYDRYVFSRAGEEDIPEIASFSGISENTLYARCNNGDCCHVARDTRDSNRIVNILWCHRGACFVRGFGIKINVQDNNSIYLYGAYTHPTARMKGIINTAIKEVCEYYYKKGARRVYGLVERPNRNSYNFHLKLNFKPVADVIFISFLCFKLSCYKDLQERKKRFSAFIAIPQNIMII